jgi:DNA/RNA-binding domain of Phe-tRNA-synthetase-like protein
MSWEPAPEQGWVAPHLSAEFPGLGIVWITVDARSGRTPDPVRQRLRNLSDRFYGSHALQLRERPIPWAYRVFFRHIGLDPDRTRTPVEQLAMERLKEGGFKARGMPQDALTIATVETGVALRAFDAERVTGALCIHDSAPGETLAGGVAVDSGTIVIADDNGPLAPLFAPTPELIEIGPATRRVTVAAVQVKGVPQISVDEALWMTAAALASYPPPHDAAMGPL